MTKYICEPLNLHPVVRLAADRPIVGLSARAVWFLLDPELMI
jgi:hypothetical protein